MLAFAANRLLTPTDTVEHPLMLVEHGRILEICDRASGKVPSGVSVSDFGDSVIAPGYVDLHIHGGAGYDVMDASTEALPAVERLLARHGVTAYFPTTVTASMDTTLRALERLANAIEKREQKNDKDNNDNDKDEGTSPSARHPSRRAVYQPCPARRASAGESAGSDAKIVRSVLAGGSWTHSYDDHRSRIRGRARSYCRSRAARCLRQPRAFRRRFFGC